MTIITKVRLNGFKSFAKLIELPFGNNFNIVLGPNGSGKTNITDSICFVLGKLSAKSLRAERSANLIYNGGKKGKPAKEAEVSIYFSNNEKEFPIDTKEVKLTRIVRQNGNSVYKINDEVRTREQVLDILRAGKIEPDGHNIILQGEISRFMEMKPVERREIIEEISGISVYEEKKDKAMNELEKVEGKLSEANIILTEREAYLRELKKDYERASKFKEAESNIKSSKATYLHLHIKDKQDKKNKIESKIDEQKKSLNKLQSKINELNNLIKNKKQEIENINAEIEQKGEKEQIQLQKNVEELKTNLVKSNSRLETCENEIKRISSRISQLKQDSSSIDSTISKLKEKISELGDKKQEIAKNEKLIDSNLNALKEKYGIKDLEKKSFELDSIENNIENLNQELQKKQDEKQEKQREFDQIQIKIENIDEKLEHLLEQEKADEEVFNLVKKLKQEFKDSTLKLVKLISEEQAISSNLQKARIGLMNKNEELSKLKIKQTSINEFFMEDRALKKILNSNIKGVHGTIAGLGETDSRYSLALEVAAGGRMKNIVTDTDLTATKCIKLLKDSKLGIATFLPLNKIKSRVEPKELSQIKKNFSGIKDLAINLVKFNSRYKNTFSYIFGSTLVVDNLETVRKIGVGRIRMVTLEGDLVEPSGAMVGGFRARRSGFGFKESDINSSLSTLESEINKLKLEIKNYESNKVNLEDNIIKLKQKKSEIEGDIIKHEKTLDIIDTEDLSSEKKRLLELQNKINLKEIELKIKKIFDDIGKLKVRRQELRKVIDSSLGSKSDELDELEKEKQKIREDIIQIENEIKSNNQLISTIHVPEKEKIKGIIKQHEKESEEFKKEYEELINIVKEQKSELKEKEKKEKQFYSDYKNLFTKRNKLNDETSKREDETSKELEKVKSVELKINDINLSRAKVVAEVEGLEKEFEVFKDAKIRKGVSLEQLQSQIKEYEKVLSNLGNVNLRALEIFEKVKEEHTKLVEKTDKLKEEKESVLEMMAEIETNKKDLFMKTFKEISKNFKDIFSSLTEKGEGFLDIEDENDIFNTGIDIKVRIVGNKFLDIRSLSGGEKTLAALSLIFAIQEYDPASFYLLDEVDAALDKKNSELLSKLIKKYSSRSQYIVISHNDALITESDQIYGVSMKNGISKIVSLKI